MMQQQQQQQQQQRRLQIQPLHIQAGLCQLNTVSISDVDKIMKVIIDF